MYFSGRIYILSAVCIGVVLGATIQPPAAEPGLPEPVEGGPNDPVAEPAAPEGTAAAPVTDQSLAVAAGTEAPVAEAEHTAQDAAAAETVAPVAADTDPPAAVPADTQAPAVAQTDAPGEEQTDVPAAQTDAPVAQTDAPAAPTDAPAAETNAPAALETQAAETAAPAVTQAAETEAPAAPVVTDAPKAEPTTEAKEEKVETKATEAQTQAAAMTTQAAEQPTTVAAQKQDAETVKPTEAVIEETTVKVTVDPTDPCQNFELLADDKRHFSYKADDKDAAMNDRGRKDGWYSFSYQGNPAEIPTVCIKSGQCNTFGPLYLDEEAVTLPTVAGEAVNTTLCSIGDVAGEAMCCAYKTDVTVHRCDGFYVYFLNAQTIKVSVCTKLPNEDIAPEYMGNPPPVTEAPTTVATTTLSVMDLYDLPITPMDNMTSGGLRNVVTIEYKHSSETLEKNYMEEFDKKLRPLIAKKLNELVPEVTTAAEVEQTTVAVAIDVTTQADEMVTEGEEGAGTTEETQTDAPASENDVNIGGSEDVNLPGVSNKQGEAAPDQPQIGPEVPDSIDAEAAKDQAPVRKRRDTPVYTEDNVYYVEPSPRMNDNGDLQMIVYVQENDGENTVPADRVMAALDNLNETGLLESETDATLVTYYAGLPDDVKSPRPAAATDDRDIWEQHMGLFITVIILIAICIIVIIIGLICLKCKSKKSWNPNEKTPLKNSDEARPHHHENPLSDDVIIADEAPNVHSAPNGSSKKEDSWLVPLEQLNDGDKYPRPMEHTKL